MNCKKTLVIIPIIMCLMLGSSSDVGTVHVRAATTQEKLDQAKKEKDELKKQLEDTNENLDGLKSSQKSLKKELNKLNAKLTEVCEHLADLESRIADKEAEIEQTEAELQAALDLEAWQYECMVIRLKAMYERNDTSMVNALLGEGTLSGILNAADFYEAIASYDRQKMAEFKANREYIEQVKAQLEVEREELGVLKQQAEEEQAKVNDLIAQTSSAIAKYADQIDEAEKEALEYEAQIKAKESDIKTLQKKLAEELAMSQAAANAKWRDISEVKFQEGDRFLLANLIYCEAGGEPYAGQLAVGSVVINRVLSSKYPDTLVGVIYQKSQFSPVASGRLDLALSVNKATANCYKAADEAMSGVTNVGNCVYFRTPIEGLTGINIGGHVFY